MTRSIHQALQDEISAAIIAEISMATEPISAKDISKNLDIPQSTIYDHLRNLEIDGLIKAEEIKVRNLVKKLWTRTGATITPRNSLVRNQFHNFDVSKEPLVANSHIRNTIASSRKLMAKIQNMDPQRFAKFQKESKTPCTSVQFLLNKDDYEFALSKMFELIVLLKARNSESTNPDRVHRLPEETNLFFFMALPDIEEE